MKMETPRLAILATILLALAMEAPALMDSAVLTEELHKAYPLGAGGRVALRNINGAVRITAWDKNEVKVDAVKKASTKEALAEASIMIDASADSVSIRTEYPKNSERRNPASVEYTLMVPRAAILSSIDLVNGSITISGVSGEVKAKSVNGAVKADKLAGDARLSTVNGRVEAEFDRLEAHSIDMHSVNGAVIVSLPYKTDAELAASTVHGGIHNDFGLIPEGRRGPGRSLSTRIGKGGAARIKLHTVNGAIDIRSMADGRRVRSL